jgi:hypothetical protein
MAERRIVYMPVAELVSAPRNAKGHDTEAMMKSVDAFGWIEPIVLDGRTGMIVSGHGRRDYLADAELHDREAADWIGDDGLRIDEQGRWCTPVVVGWESTDDAHAEAAGIALNRVGEGVWDRGTLADALDDLVTKYGDAIGFTPMDLDDLRLSIAPPILDDLADQVGKHDPQDAWPAFRVRLPPPLVERMGKWWAALEGETDIDKAEALTS